MGGKIYKIYPPKKKKVLEAELPPKHLPNHQLLWTVVNCSQICIFLSTWTPGKTSQNKNPQNQDLDIYYIYTHI